MMVLELYMVEISLVKAAFLKKVIDTRAIYKLGGIGLAFKRKILIK